jgi:hypothetical protein
MLVAVLCLGRLPAGAELRGNSLAYEGRLRQAGILAQGVYDFRFELYDAPRGGSPVGPPLFSPAVRVTDGHFHVVLDFDPATFTGEARWLQVAVRSGTADFSVLEPLQPLVNIAAGSAVDPGFAEPGAVAAAGLPTDRFSANQTLVADSHSSLAVTSAAVQSKTGDKGRTARDAQSSGGSSGAPVPIILTINGTNVAVDATQPAGTVGSLEFRLMCTNNVFIQNPANASDGERITFELIQDGTGRRQASWDSNFSFGSDITGVSLTPTPYAQDFVSAIYNASATKWYVVSLLRGYAGPTNLVAFQPTGVVQTNTPSNYSNAVPIMLTINNGTVSVDATQPAGTSGPLLFRVSCTSDVFIQNPANATDGQRIVFELIQAPTGNHHATWDSNYAFGLDLTGVALTATPNKRDFVGAVYNASSGKWYVTSYVKGY